MDTNGEWSGCPPVSSHNYCHRMDSKTCTRLSMNCHSIRKISVPNSVNEAWGLSGLPKYKARIQGLRLTAIWIVIRWISVLAQGSSPPISYGLITTYVDPSSVSKDVPTLRQVQADCQRQTRQNPAPHRMNL